MKEQKVGVVVHYYSKIAVAVVKLEADLAVGDEIKIKGVQTDFNQNVQSLQVEHRQIKQAAQGDMVGLKVSGKVREGDMLYKISDA